MQTIALPMTPPKLDDAMAEVDGLGVAYGPAVAVRDITLRIARHRITALIGPSGCGKSTLLRCFNRMNDLIDGVRVTGSLRVGGQEIYSPSIDVTDLRRRVGMVFQRSVTFPKSIFDNVAYGPRLLGVRRRPELFERVVASLKSAALWDEVKDRLRHNALGLSGGQQQRLCIARALAVDPEVLLLDEPCSSLDPTATGRIEELLLGLKERYTIVIVTHNIGQSSRISDTVGFMLNGRLVEFGPTARLFQTPEDPATEAFISGRLG
jgi:phosphate transport system ATP-binding protein